jgi:hypothetical protein
VGVGSVDDEAAVWRKRQIVRESIRFNIRGSLRVFNFLQSNDSSFRDVDQLTPNSIAVTEAAEFTFNVTNAGFVNATAAAAKMLAQAFAADVSITCTHDGPNGGVTVDPVPVISATFNGTLLNSTFSDARDGGFDVLQAGNPIGLRWRTNVLNVSDSASITFTVRTTAALADSLTGQISCFAKVDNLLASDAMSLPTLTVPVEPIVFVNGTTNATVVLLAERRTDFTVGAVMRATALSGQTEPTLFAGVPSSAVEVIISVTNNGPIVASQVVVDVGITRVRLLDDFTVTVGVSGESFGDSQWRIDNLPVGVTKTLTIVFRDPKPELPEGSVAQVVAYVRGANERPIFTFDDKVRLSVNCVRLVDFELTHQFALFRRLDADGNRNDTAEFALQVTNNGPAASAGVVVQVSARLPDGVRVARVVADGEVISQQRVLKIGEDRDEILPHGRFQFFVAGALGVGERKQMRVFLLPPPGKHQHAGSPLSVGAAISRQYTAEKTVHLPADDSIVFTQSL